MQTFLLPVRCFTAIHYYYGGPYLSMYNMYNEYLCILCSPYGKNLYTPAHMSANHGKNLYASAHMSGDDLKHWAEWMSTKTIILACEWISNARPVQVILFPWP